MTTLALLRKVAGRLFKFGNETTCAHAYNHSKMTFYATDSNWPELRTVLSTRVSL